MTSPATIGSVEEVRRVVAQLTKAMRAAVIRGSGTGMTLVKIMRVNPPIFGRADYSNGYGWLSFPTPLGIAVRNHLLASERGS